MGTSLADCILIGVDGGASKVRACSVRRRRNDSSRLYLGHEQAVRIYPSVPGFCPVSGAVQATQRQAGTIHLTESELAQGAAYAQATADAVAQVAADAGIPAGTRLPVGATGGLPTSVFVRNVSPSQRPVLVGVCMAGLKSADGRGIEQMNNGPRIPDYLDQLEAGLGERGIVLVAPIARLSSDADCCGLGEQFGEDGLFAGVDNAYYVGGGSGLADALKLNGRVIPFDDVSAWLLKSWQLGTAGGQTFEERISLRAMNARWAKLLGHDVEDPEHRVERQAAAGDVRAATVLGDVATALAELIFERIETVYRGRTTATGRGKAYMKLKPDHAFRGTLLDRVVIGQRLGSLFGDQRLTPHFRQPVEHALGDLFVRCDDPALRHRYLSDVGLVSDLLRPSTLAGAPVIGAIVAAMNATSK
ncbi:MAG: hypothetical protein IID37_08670 [Planctomycetes bacterium]|nr:hypothetical protein [Planctomycetota bacterium]